MKKDVAYFKKFECISEYIKPLGFITITNPDFYIFRYNEINEFENVYQNSFKNSFFEILLDLSLGCPYSVDGYECKATKNRLNVVSPFRLQSVSNSDEHKEEPNGYSLFFKPEFLDFNLENRNLTKRLPFIGYNVNPVVQLNDDTIHEFINIFERIHHNQSNPIPDSINIIKHYLSILLQLIKNHSSFTLQKSNSRENQIFEEFRLLLETHYLKFTSVKQFADKLNLSPKHFSETIKNLTGKTVIQFIIDKKIDCAKSFLKHTSMSSKQIAVELQFESDLYFYTFFKKNTGNTPSQYRNN